MNLNMSPYSYRLASVGLQMTLNDLKSRLPLHRVKRRRSFYQQDGGKNQLEKWKTWKKLRHRHPMYAWGKLTSQNLCSRYVRHFNLA